MGLLCNSFANKVAGLQSIDKFTENKMFGKIRLLDKIIRIKEIIIIIIILRTSSA